MTLTVLPRLTVGQVKLVHHHLDGQFIALGGIYPKDQSRRYLCEKTNQTEHDLTTYSILSTVQTTEQT